MTDIENAKKIFNDENCPAVFCRDDEIIKITENGLKPLVELAESGKDLFDFSVCDKVTGRAAAFLYVLLGVKEVHAIVMAKLAIQILDRAEIKYSADTFADEILNNEKTAPDIFEEAVLRSGSAIKALEDIKKALVK